MAGTWWQKLTAGLRRRAPDEEAAMRAFRMAVAAAVTGSPDRATLDSLIRRAQDDGLPPDETELEVEVLQGALELIDLQARVAATGLPAVPHQHKALAGETCHFLASAFLASDASQRTGRLFLTDRRLVFVSTPVVALPWGAIARMVDEDRDLIVAAPGRGVVHRFRCNSFADARCAQWLGERLKATDR